MFSFKHVLLNSRLHFAFTIFVEIFSSSRTDFRRSTGKLKIRDPKETTDIANNADNTNNFEFIISSDVSINPINHCQGHHFYSFLL